MAKTKILIIEDERALVEPLAYSLSREGFEVLTAYDGLDGLRQAQVRLPDLIVLDLMLPVNAGLDVCKELRAGSQTRDIPIIMVTAKAEETDELVGFAVGCRRLRDQALPPEGPDRADQEGIAPPGRPATSRPPSR